jgi:hypothetical protein
MSPTHKQFLPSPLSATNQALATMSACSLLHLQFGSASTSKIQAASVRIGEQLRLQVQSQLFLSGASAPNPPLNLAPLRSAGRPAMKPPCAG